MDRSEAVIAYHSPVKGVSIGDQLQSIETDLEYYEGLLSECTDSYESFDLNVAIAMLQAISNYLQSA